MKTCDRKSVGVIITDIADNYLLLTRVKPPAGRAPVAGHVDEHGGALAAAIAETREEVGLELPLREVDLVADGFLPNLCRRAPGLPLGPAGHHWWIYQARVGGGEQPVFSADETRGGGWVTARVLQVLAERTGQWATGQISDQDYLADPGLEPAWVHWLRHLGRIRLPQPQLLAAEAKFREPAQI